MLATTDKMLFLKRVPLFAKMSLEQIQVLTSHLEEQHFLPGEAILRCGKVILVFGPCEDVRQANDATDLAQKPAVAR